MSGYKANMKGTLSTTFQFGRGGITIIYGTDDPNADAVDGMSGDVYVRGGATPAAYQHRNGFWLPLGAPRRTTVSSAYSATLSDQYIGVRSNTATTITLPEGIAGLCLMIKDELGVAASHPITIVADGGDTIDGQQSFTIDANYEKVSLLFGDEWHVI